MLRYWLKKERELAICSLSYRHEGKSREGRPFKLRRRILAVMLGDDQRLRNARNAIGKDGHQSRAGRKPSHRKRGKAGVRPAVDWIDREKNNLAALEAAQLHDRVIAR